MLSKIMECWVSNFTKFNFAPNDETVFIHSFFFSFSLFPINANRCLLESVISFRLKWLKNTIGSCHLEQLKQNR